MFFPKLVRIALVVASTAAFCRCCFAAELEPIASFTTRRINALAFSSDGAFLVTGCLVDKPCVWSVPEGKLLNEVTDFSAGVISQSEIACLSVSRNGRLLAGGNGRNETAIWELPSCRKLATCELTTRHTIFTRDSKTLIVAAQNGVHFLNVESIDKKPDRPFLKLEKLIGLALSPSEKILVTQRDTSTLSHLPSARVEVWDVATKRQIAQIDNMAMHLDFSPDGKLLAMVGDDLVSFWNTKNWQQQTTRRIHGDFVSSFEFCPTGETYAIVGVSKTLDDAGKIASYKSWLRVYDTQSGDVLAETHGEEREFAFASYAPDGHTLASFGSGNVRLWKLKLK